MNSVKKILLDYLECIEKLISRIDSDVNNVLSAGWYTYFNEYSDKEFKLLEGIANDLSLLSFQNMILNLCNLYKNDKKTISLHKIIDYLDVNYKNLNIDKNVAISFVSLKRECLLKIEKKRIYCDIFKNRDCQIAHIDKKMIASFKTYGEENIYFISLISMINNLINPAKRIVEDIYNLLGIVKKYKRKYDNRFKKIYKAIIEY